MGKEHEKTEPIKIKDESWAAFDFKEVWSVTFVKKKSKVTQSEWSRGSRNVAGIQNRSRDEDEDEDEDEKIPIAVGFFRRWRKRTFSWGVPDKRQRRVGTRERYSDGRVDRCPRRIKWKILGEGISWRVAGLVGARADTPRVRKFGWTEDMEEAWTKPLRSREPRRENNAGHREWGGSRIRASHTERTFAIECGKIKRKEASRCGLQGWVRQKKRRKTKYIKRNERIRKVEFCLYRTLSESNSRWINTKSS